MPTKNMLLSAIFLCSMPAHLFAGSDPFQSAGPAEHELVARTISDAGANGVELKQALSAVPAGQSAAMSFLIANMPVRDAQTLTADFLLKNVALATATRSKYPWCKDIPDEIFLNYVLPYASLNEKRDDWRSDFETKMPPLVKDAKTASDAALALNKGLFPLVKVQYHPSKRPKPDQSPSESMAANYASCSGLSILLVDACRSVGVPARIVGTPHWYLGHTDMNGNHGGNHTWVQIWDGRWHTLGASEVSALDDVWFNGNAGKAHESQDPLNQIYAARWAKSEVAFPMVWAMDAKYVPADVVTADYGPKREWVLKGGPTPANWTVRRGDQLIAFVPFASSAKLMLAPGAYEVTVNGTTTTITVPPFEK